MTSAAIVGAGISGLLSAYYAVKGAACSSLRVYEARSDVGRPHCTGLISIETADRIPFAKEYVESVFSSLRILIPEIKANVTIAFEDRGFVRIDRVRLEKRLYYELESLGVEVSRKDPVYAVTDQGERWLIRSRRGVNSYDLLILTSGYNPRLTKAAGLSCKVDVLSGVQVELETEGRSPFGGDTVSVILSKHFGNGFSWIVPTGERTLVVGCATKPEAIESTRCLELVLSLLSKVRGRIRPIARPYGGVVLRGYPVRPYNDRAMGVGDSVSMVKSLSGGGLYALSIASRFVGAFVARRLGHLRHIDLLSKRLRGHYLLASAIEAAIRAAETLGLKDVQVDVWTRGISYDDHLAILFGVLGNRRSFFELAKGRRATLRIDADRRSTAGRLFI